jgi:hypothetical protein
MKPEDQMMSMMAFPLTYRQTSLAASLVCTVLFAVLLFYPPLIFWLFGIIENAAADFMTRRGAILFLGLAAITFLTRSEPDSAARRAIANSLFITMAGLASLGIFELLRGTAGIGILLAVFAEALFAVLYLPFCREGENRSS